jgi:arylsulfatase A-like enzyme
MLDVKGLPPEEHDPAVHSENRNLWLSGRIDKLASPYYGFQSTDFLGSHGDHVYGEYNRWLAANHPQAVPLLSRERARVPRSGADQSWKSALPAELHHTTWVADRSIDFLRAAGQGRPFFLLCSFADPHHPYCPPAPYDSLYDPDEIPMPNRREGELELLAPFFREILERGRLVSGRLTRTCIADEHLREIIAHTFGMVALIDHQVGRVLAELESSGLREDTIVVFLSDHGDMLGDHWMLNKGPFHFDGLLRVPFIWSWPGRFPAGFVSDSLASLLDFAPTLLDLCGVPFPEGERPAEPEAHEAPRPHPGFSLEPILAGAARSVRERLVVENDEDYLGLRLRTLVTPRHKLTLYAGEPYGELFDLERDPNEQRNLFGDADHHELRRDLSAQLLDELILTDSALPRRLNHA